MFRSNVCLLATCLLVPVAFFREEITPFPVSFPSEEGLVGGKSEMSEGIIRDKSLFVANDPMYLPDTLSDAERNLAITQLEASQVRVAEALAGLTPAQIDFKADSASWSIAEVAEHIAVAETGIFGIVVQQLQTPPNADGRRNIQVSDADIYTRLTNRKGKVASPEILVPTGRFADISQTVGYFNKNRNETIRFIASSEEDLRNRYWKHPATGVIDLYQTILLLSAHTERHVLQILEIKQHPDFPQ